MLSRDQPQDLYFRTEDPHPPIQILKLFSESYIVLRESPLPSQHSVLQNLSCFMSEWERVRSIKLPDTLKDDAYNVCLLSPLFDTYFNGGSISRTNLLLNTGCVPNTEKSFL